MEKTIIINIGNTIIHIEESAYERLKVYLNEVKQYFANHADDLEIVADIENRIAELFTEVLAEEKKQVIDSANVDAVIGQMGRVQDFHQEADAQEKEAKTENLFAQQSEKRLYRDLDDRVIAGICAGVGHFVNLDAKWIRIATVLSIFLGGFGVVVYAILWIIMPAAKSRVEKMEMRGEPANLQGFQKNLDEELQAIKERLKVANQHARPIFVRLGDFIVEFVAWLGRLFGAVGHLALKISAIFIILFGALALLFILAGTAFFQGFFDGNLYDYFPLSIIDENHRGISLFCAAVVIFIPILALVLFAIRVAFSKKSLNKTLSFVLLIVWLAAVAVAGYQAAKISTEFKEHAQINQTLALKKQATYIIDIDRSKFFSKEDSINYKIGPNAKNQIVIDDYQDHPFHTPSNVHIEIEKGEGAIPNVVQTFESNGKTFQLALQNAQNINYSFTQKDDKIILNPRFQLKKGSIWRGQRTFLKFSFPVGTILKLKESVYRYTDYYGDCETVKGGDYSVWIMTEDGLKCVAQMKRDALKKKQLQDELGKLEQLKTERTSDTLYQDSVSNRIKEINSELGNEEQND